MRRRSSSCSKVSFMPSGFAPPHPKHPFSGFGFSLSFTRFLCLLYFHVLVSSHQRDSAPIHAPRAPLPLFHFHAQQLSERGDAPRDALFVYAGKPQAERVGLGALNVEI